VIEMREKMRYDECERFSRTLTEEAGSTLSPPRRGPGQPWRGLKMKNPRRVNEA